MPLHALFLEINTNNGKICCNIMTLQSVNHAFICMIRATYHTISMVCTFGVLCGIWCAGEILINYSRYNKELQS